MVRTSGVVLRDEEAAGVRDADAEAWVSLEGTRLVGVGVGELLLLLLLLSLLLVAGGCEVSAGGSEVVSGSLDVAGGAEDAGGVLEAGGADDAGGGVEVAGGAEEAGVLLPVPEAWRFSSWWRYSLMPSMCRPSKLKADTMATSAKSVTNNQAWRNMATSGVWGGGTKGWRLERSLEGSREGAVGGVDLFTAADAFHGQWCEGARVGCRGAGVDAGGGRGSGGGQRG